MSFMTDNAFGRTVSIVEEKTGYSFSPAETFHVLLFTVRKCKINGKDSDYIPILFENELTDYVARSAINYISGLNEGITKEALFNV